MFDLGLEYMFGVSSTYHIPAIVQYKCIRKQVSFTVRTWTVSTAGKQGKVGFPLF